MEQSQSNQVNGIGKAKQFLVLLTVQLADDLGFHKFHQQSMEKVAHLRSLGTLRLGFKLLSVGQERHERAAQAIQTVTFLVWPWMPITTFLTGTKMEALFIPTISAVWWLQEPSF